jgi:1-acyl-sn-glycerol-3-phosphate acyltransferase
LFDVFCENDGSPSHQPDPSTPASTPALRTKRPEDRLPIRVLHAVNTLFTRVYHNLTVLEPSHLPLEGPAIVVCNHISGLDPLLVQSACKHRLITWMMAKEYMDIPAMGRIFKTLGVIPVDRGSKDSGPLRQVFRQLEQGRVIGIFPEGRISTTNQLLDFQTGVGMIALKSKVPVYPVYLDGTQRNKEMGPAFLQRSSSVIAFGPPLTFDRPGTARDTSKERIDAVTQSIKSAVFALQGRVDSYSKVR